MSTHTIPTPVAARGVSQQSIARIAAHLRAIQAMVSHDLAGDLRTIDAEADQPFTRAELALIEQAMERISGGIHELEDVLAHQVHVVQLRGDRTLRPALGGAVRRLVGATSRS